MIHNSVAIKVKCPLCGESLMDETHKVDNESSIKLVLKHQEKEGFIHLSSLYGSYNYDSDVPVPLGEVASFFCPHCTEELVAKNNCESCEASMLPFTLKIGGKVAICMRSGCQHHTIEFNDLSLAIELFYREYGFRGRKSPFEADHAKLEPLEEKETDITDEIIESGAFLQTYCPHCNKSLIENNQLKIKVVGESDGYLMLSPFLNVYTRESTIQLPEKKAVGDMRCPHCNTSLLDKTHKCDTCESDVARLSVSARTKLIDFFICSKAGCEWHGLSNEDLENIRLEDSLEW